MKTALVYKHWKYKTEKKCETVKMAQIELNGIYLKIKKT